VANSLYDAGRQAFLSASISWLTATVVPYLVGSYAINLAADTFLSDIPAAAWRARGTYLTSRTAAAGVADAADTTVANVGSAGSATAVYLALVAETGASQSSLLIAAIDTASVLPFLPNGGDINIVWDNAANRIFKL
jgi:hypothetical protein